MLVPASFPGAGPVPRARQKNSISILLCKEFGNNEGPDNSRFQFQLSLLQTMSRVYVLFSKKTPSSHPPCSSLPSHFRLEAEQTGPFSGEGDPAVDYTLPPPLLLFVHHLPLSTLTHSLPTLFIICPHSNPMVPLGLPVHLCINLPGLIGPSSGLCLAG